MRTGSLVAGIEWIAGWRDGFERWFERVFSAYVGTGPSWSAVALELCLTSKAAPLERMKSSGAAAVPP